MHIFLYWILPYEAPFGFNWFMRVKLPERKEHCLPQNPDQTQNSTSNCVRSAQIHECDNIGK